MGVTLEGFLKCQTIEQSRIVSKALPEHIRLTLAEPGCLRFEVTETEDPLVWRVSEAFTDAAAFEAHQTRAASSDWARLTKDIARDYQITGLQ